MGAPTAREKQAILDEVAAQLTDLNVTESERKAITRPYTQMIAWDFYLLFMRTFDRYLNWKKDDLVRRQNVNQTEESKKAAQEFPAKQSAWRSLAFADGRFGRLDTFKFAEELRQVMPTALLDKREQRAAEAFAAQLVRMVEECDKKGGYTTEAADFYDHYHDSAGNDEKIKELFGVNPSELR